MTGYGTRDDELHNCVLVSKSSLCLGRDAEGHRSFPNNSRSGSGLYTGFEGASGMYRKRGQLGWRNCMPISQSSACMRVCVSGLHCTCVALNWHAPSYSHNFISPVRAPVIRIHQRHMSSPRAQAVPPVGATMLPCDHATMQENLVTIHHRRQRPGPLWPRRRYRASRVRPQ